MTAPRVVVVAKRSAFQRYVIDEEDPRVRMLMKRRDPTVSLWKRTHDAHKRTLAAVFAVLEKIGARITLVRGAHQKFHTEDAHLVVTVGGDGTLLAASHNVGSAPLLGVNSATTSSVGFFCAAHVGTVAKLVPRAVDGTLPGIALTRMQVEVEGRIRTRRVLNEALFCHASPAATSRYILELGQQSEEHRSSGVWIGPAAGSTAAQRSAGGRVLPLGSKRVQLVVREPYGPPGHMPRLLRAILEPGDSACIRSKMGDARIFIDGPDECFHVRLGDALRFRASDEPLTVLGLSTRRVQSFGKRRSP